MKPNSQPHLLSLYCLIIFSFLGIYLGFSQDIQGIIIAIEGERIYLDLNQDNVSVEDRLQVGKEGSYFVHPVTGEQIYRGDEVVAHIEIIEVFQNYSIGRAIPRSGINSLEIGMAASHIGEYVGEIREFRKAIAVQPINVVMARGGYLGLYMAELMSEELYNLDRFRIIDRQTIGLQIDEIALGQQGVVDENQVLGIGRISGIDYFITGTVNELDVVDVTTGVPLQGMVKVAEAASGRRLGSNLVSDVRVSQLHAVVGVTMRVVNVETGEILFIATEMQQAAGRGEVNLERGVLGGLELQGGATSFAGSITGQATRNALKNLAGYIDEYFEGEINVRNFQGNIIKIENVGTRKNKREMRSIRKNERREERRENHIARITHSELNVSEPSNLNQSFIVNLNRGSNFGLRKSITYEVYIPKTVQSEITGETRIVGHEKIGEIQLNIIEKDVAQGELKIFPGVMLPKDFNFSEAEIPCAFVKWNF